MTEYQYSCNMLSISEISEIEALLNKKQFTTIADRFRVDPLSRLYVTEGSAFPDYVAGFQLDCIRTSFACRLLTLHDKFNNPIYCLKVSVEKGADNLWRKFWTITVR